MATTPALFKIRFPEFVAVDDDRIQLFLDDAADGMSAVIWGERFDTGQAYLAAHFLVNGENSAAGGAGSGGKSGPVASRSVDGTSVSYAQVSLTSGLKNEAFYQSTIYGQRYLAILNTLGVAAYVV